MGREIRRVPPNWEHPTSWEPGQGFGFQPMFDTSAEDAVAEWYRDRRRFWISKNLRTFIGPVYRWLVDKKREGIIGKIRDAFVFRFDDLRLEAPTLKFEDWHREFPDPESYRPRWKRGEATWYQVYETVSEGTPVTPPFETREELVEYLVERGDFWDQKRREDKSTDPADCEP